MIISLDREKALNKTQCLKKKKNSMSIHDIDSQQIKNTGKPP